MLKAPQSALSLVTRVLFLRSIGGKPTFTFLSKHIDFSGGLCD